MLYAALQRRTIPASYDQAVLWVALLLLAVGLVMVYSASIAVAEASRHTNYNSLYYFSRHGVYIAVGLMAAFVSFQFSLRFWQDASPFLFLFGLGLLALVLVPGVGKEVNGSQRWISLGVMQVQPSEMVKLFAVLYAADYTVRKAGHMHSLLRGFLPMAGVMLLTGTMLLLEPDFGALAVITCVAMGILFLGGLNFKLVAVLLGVLASGFVLLVINSPYRLKRWTTFLDPWADPFDKGYQPTQALMAIGRGEWTGVGLGGSVAKLFYLPEAHTDFLLTVIAEEMGLVGVLVVIALFAVLVWRAFDIGRVSVRLERYFAALVAQGIGLWFGLQAFINMGVNLTILPTKGLTLPLMSYGGSGVVVNCVAIAVLLRVDYENRQLMRGYSV